MTDAQEDPELRRLMNAYVQSILARNRSVPIIGEFIVSFSHMQASIEDAVVEIWVGTRKSSWRASVGRKPPDRR